MKSKRLVLMVTLLVLMCMINLVRYVSSLKDAGIPEQQQSYGPLPFESIASKVIISDVVDQMAERSLPLHLPAYLPDKVILTTAYSKTLDGNASFPLELVYSNTGDESIESAELIIEVMPMSEIPFNVTNDNAGKFTMIGDMSAFILDKAPVGWDEYAVKYGTENAILIDVKIDSLNYLFRFSPVFSMEDAIKVVASL